MAVIQLVVSLNQETGQVHVAGPIENKTFCLQLLAEAVKVMANYTPKATETKAKLYLPTNGGGHLPPPPGAA